MISRKFYVHVQFYCVHTFRGNIQILMYNSNRKVQIHDGFVEDVDAHHDGFQDIRMLQHLCTKVLGYGEKIYFVDESEVMEGHLREDMLTYRRG